MSTGTAEPVVHGSVRALRTFRLLDDGVLAPLTAGASWAPGVTTATCDRGAPAGHRPPEPGCTCGLWAYGDLQSLRESDLREQDDVVAVVSCHGRVVPAERGLRAEHAVVDAVWLSPRVDRDVGARLAARYPRTAVYRSVAAMLAEHPLTVLPGYRLPGVPWRPAVHLQLAVTVVWWLAVLVWLVATLPGPRPSDRPLGVLDPVVLLTPVLVAAGTALLLSAPRRWPWGLAALALQTALALVSAAVLDEWLASEHLSMVAGAGGTLHVLVAYRVWRLRLGRPSRRRRSLA